MAWGSQSRAGSGAQFPGRAVAGATPERRGRRRRAPGGRARRPSRAQANSLQLSWRAGQVFPVGPG